MDCTSFAVTWKSGEKRCRNCGLAEEEHGTEVRLKYDQSVGKDPESLLRQREHERELQVKHEKQRKEEEERNAAYVAKMLAIYKVGMKVFVRLGNSNFEGTIVTINEADKSCDCEVYGSIEARMPFCALQIIE